MSAIPRVTLIANAVGKFVNQPNLPVGLAEQKRPRVRRQVLTCKTKINAFFTYRQEWKYFGLTGLLLNEFFCGKHAKERFVVMF